MSTDTLEPTLTKTDLRVLAAIPACGPDEWGKRGLDEAVTLWQLGEALLVNELLGLAQVLSGLERLDYVYSAVSRSRKRRVYWRTPKGDRAVSA